MRIDKYLKNSRLIKRRTVAKEACDGGRISINGKPAKAGSEVKEGDEITIVCRPRRARRNRRMRSASIGSSPLSGSSSSTTSGEPMKHCAKRTRMRMPWESERMELLARSARLTAASISLAVRRAATGESPCIRA